MQILYTTFCVPLYVSLITTYDVYDCFSF